MFVPPVSFLILSSLRHAGRALLSASLCPWAASRVSLSGWINGMPKADITVSVTYRRVTQAAREEEGWVGGECDPRGRWGGGVRGIQESGVQGRPAQSREKATKGEARILNGDRR